jgi:hypothetical protein
MAIKVFGGAAAVAVAVGLGGVGVNAAGSNPTTASRSSTGSGSGVHIATLTDFAIPRTCVVRHSSAGTGQAMHVWYTPAPCAGSGESAPESDALGSSR